MTQFFLATNLEALTGRSQTSKVLTRVWKESRLIVCNIWMRHISDHLYGCEVSSLFLYKQFGTTVTLASYLSFMVPNTDAAVVQTSQHPWLSWVKVHTLHPVWPGCQPPLNVQPQRLKRRKEISVSKRCYRCYIELKVYLKNNEASNNNW